MGGVFLCNMQCYCSLLALLLCSCFLHPSQAFHELHGGRYYDEEKVPMTVIVPDPSPEVSPVAAPPPVSGADDDLPRLPSERWRSGGAPRYNAGAPAAVAPFEPSAGPAGADAPSPLAGSGAPFISSNPAVPLPTGVTDTATILPMPAPGAERQEVGEATLAQARMVLLVLCVMMLSFWALW